MSKSNLGESIRQRLKNYAKQHNESFNLILVRFGLERLLYRLTTTTAADEFILKGGSLFYCWTKKLHRPTRDIDLLGKGEPSPERFRGIFLRAIETKNDDGLVFDSASLEITTMKDEQEYRGLRVSVIALLDNARIKLQVDIGFGDATTPNPTLIQYPVLLDLPAPEILAYQKETVIAEKFQAIVDLGIANSRMKDFFDLWTFATQFEFDGVSLANAVEATFDRRETEVPTAKPLALTREFSEDPSKQNQWNAFAAKLRLNKNLSEITALIETFIMPCAKAVREKKPFDFHWSDGNWNSDTNLQGN